MKKRERPDEKTIARRVKRLVETHAKHLDAFTRHPAASIRRTEVPDATRRIAAGADRPNEDQALRIGPMLGEGGMGLVHTAEQVSLGREVAVKSLREDFNGEIPTAMLLQEAFIMGRIEHPNILPIHDLQYDESAQPQLVLKRIEGVEWAKLMGDPDAVKEKFGEDDLLEWNLRVLMQVCNAVHFAHSRGIIHRDLKPTNVMIGSFGEVYVMDWGLALSMEPDPEGLLPLVEDAKQLAGTPQYMAPEMLGDKEVYLGPRTDVYLLGAVLYEVITDLPPHDGATMEEILMAVVRSHPEFPPEAPAELMSVCRQAMDPDPGWRHQTALDLRRSLQRFLEHAGSRRLEAQASKDAEDLRERIGAAEAGEDVGVTAISELYAECRYGYRQALQIWPDNSQAHEGLQEATLAVVQHEMAAGSARAAAQLMSTLDEPDPQLAKQVDVAVQLEAGTRQRLKHLERLHRSTDIETGSRGRGITAGLIGLMWTIAPMLGTLSPFDPESILSRLSPGLFSLGVMVGLGVMVVVERETISESRLTQHLLGGAAVAMVALIVLDLAGFILELDIPVAQSMWPLTWFCISAMLAITVDRRMWPMTIGFLGALLLCVSFPDRRFEAMTASNFVMTINMYLIWIRPPDPIELT